jgi:outer membrane protein assembly complex protein YaeT
LLAEKNIKLKIAAPRDPNTLWRAKREILNALAERGHPLASVRIHLKEVPTAAVRARFVIQDGPRVRVNSVEVSGARVMEPEKLEAQFSNIAPDAFLAGLRGKDIYTRGRLQEDLDRIDSYLKDHGHLEARVGEPSVLLTEAQVKRLIPFPSRRAERVYRITVPVVEGPLYRVRETSVSGLPLEPADKIQKVLRRLRGKVFSAASMEDAREEIRKAATRQSEETTPIVDLRYEPDREAGTLRAEFHVRQIPRFTISRIEFTGNQRFSDRYYRRRVPLKEGDWLDEEKLEHGMVRLSRSGFIKPLTRDDLKVAFNENLRTAEIFIHVREEGRQKISFSGLPGGTRSTLGLAYTVFNLLGGEEFLSAKLDAGPESLDVALGIAREGLFGSPATVGLNLYQSVFRPIIATSAGNQRLFRAGGRGVTVVANHAWNERDSIAVNYGLSRSTTTIRFSPVIEVPGVVLDQLQTNTTKSALGAGWSRASGGELAGIRVETAGGVLGGSENSVQAVLSYSRAMEDPVTSGRNTWKFRGYFAGITSYSGRSLPLASRLYPGTEFLRGFRNGELTPYVLLEQARTDGTQAWSVTSQGASLFSAFNAEYRVPLERRVELAGFLDAGTSWLVPNWLGPSTSPVLRGTSGVLRVSMGLELRLKLPVIEQPLRFFYSVNPMRLAETFLLPDGTRFRATDRRGGFGWGLGLLF